MQAATIGLPCNRQTNKYIPLCLVLVLIAQRMKEQPATRQHASELVFSCSHRPKSENQRNLIFAIPIENCNSYLKVKSMFIYFKTWDRNRPYLLTVQREVYDHIVKDKGAATISLTFNKPLCTLQIDLHYTCLLCQRIFVCPFLYTCNYSSIYLINAYIFM